jgi:signal transduction histidine kinase
MKKNNCIRFIYRHLTLILILSLSISTLNAKTVKNGKLDLHFPVMHNNKLIDLSGEWQFYWGKHLSAIQMRNLKTADKRYIKTPASWNHYYTNGTKTPTYGIATYYLRITLNEKDKDTEGNYGLRIGNIISAYKLWVNDKLVETVGNASTTAKNFKPIYLPQTCYFETESDTIDIVLQVSNFVDPVYAGIWQKIYFGPHESIKSNNWLKSGITFFFLSAFIIFFIYQFSIGFIQKSDKSHWLIAVLSFISFIKLFLDGDISVYNFLPNLDFDIYYRLWLSTFLIFPITLRLTKIAYPLDGNKLIENSLYWFYNIMFVVVITFNIQLILKNIYIIIVVTFLCGIYLLYILIIAIINGRKFSIISLISYTVMLTFIVNDLVFLASQFTFGYLSHYGIFFYILVQSIVVTSKFAFSHKKVLILSNKLAESNKNLEAIVEVRTKELYQTNLELEKTNKQKDFLISTISHDLMGFFNTLITFSKTLLKDKSLTEGQSKSISKVLQTSYNGFLLLDNILPWAKLHISHNPDFKKIDNLNSLIDENLNLFVDLIERKNLKPIVSIKENLFFNCNLGNLNTILRNLLSNAIKFSNINGQINISNKLKDGLIQIKIEDNGIGLSPEDVLTIFTPEKTLKRVGTAGERGSGLGLMIVKELVESNNGKIYCYSEIDKGTTFVIEFKLVY